MEWLELPMGRIINLAQVQVLVYHDSPPWRKGGGPCLRFYFQPAAAGTDGANFEDVTGAEATRLYGMIQGWTRWAIPEA